MLSLFLAIAVRVVLRAGLSRKAALPVRRAWKSGPSVVAGWFSRLRVAVACDGPPGWVDACR